MHVVSTEISRSMRELDRFGLSSIDEIFLPFRKLSTQDGTSTRKSYSFLESSFFLSSKEQNRV